MSYTNLNNEIIMDNNLKADEKMLFIGLVRYYNTKIAYAYPKYENLMDVLGTKRRSKVSNLLKSLVKKGYIMVQKVGRKSIYCFLKYLNNDNTQPKVEEVPQIEEVKEEKTVVKKVKEVVKKAVKEVKNEVLDGQINVYQFLSSVTKNNDDKIELVKTKIPNLSNEEEKEIVKYSYDNIKTVLNSATTVNFKYLITGLKISLNKNINGFNNFESRSYDYDALERALLGW